MDETDVTAEFDDIVETMLVEEWVAMGADRESAEIIWRGLFESLRK